MEKKEKQEIKEQIKAFKQSNQKEKTASELVDTLLQWNERENKAYEIFSILVDPILDHKEYKKQTDRFAFESERLQEMYSLKEDVWCDDILDLFITKQIDEELSVDEILERISKEAECEYAEWEILSQSEQEMLEWEWATYKKSEKINKKRYYPKICTLIKEVLPRIWINVKALKIIRWKDVIVIQIACLSKTIIISDKYGESTYILDFIISPQIKDLKEYGRWKLSSHAFVLGKVNLKHKGEWDNTEWRKDDWIKEMTNLLCTKISTEEKEKRWEEIQRNWWEDKKWVIKRVKAGEMRIDEKKQRKINKRIQEQYPIVVDWIKEKYKRWAEDLVSDLIINGNYEKRKNWRIEIRWKVKSLKSIWIMLFWSLEEAATKNWINRWAWASEEEVWLIVWKLYWEAKRKELEEWAFELQQNKNAEEIKKSIDKNYNNLEDLVRYLIINGNHEKRKDWRIKIRWEAKSLQSIWQMLCWSQQEAANQCWVKYWHWASEEEVWLIVWMLYWEAKKKELEKFAYEESLRKLKKNKEEKQNKNKEEIKLSIENNYKNPEDFVKNLIVNGNYEKRKNWRIKIRWEEKSLKSMWPMLFWSLEEAAIKNWINSWQWKSEDEVWLIIWKLYWEAKKKELENFAYEESLKKQNKNQKEKQNKNKEDIKNRIKNDYENLEDLVRDLIINGNCQKRKNWRIKIWWVCKVYE